MRIIFFWLCFVFTTVSLSAQQQIPLKHFVQLPDTEQVQISPSGKKIAILKRVLSNGKRLLVIEVIDMETGNKSYPIVRKKNEFGVNEIIWASDEIILIKIDFFKQLKKQNTGNNPRIMFRRLRVVNLNDNSQKSILSGKALNRFQGLEWEPQFQDYIVDMLPSEPDHILHAVDWNLRNAPQVFKVNLKTLDRQVVMPGKEYWSSFLTDRQSNLRIGIYKETDSGGFVDTRTSYEVNVKDLQSKDWDVLWEFDDDAENEIWPLGFLPDPNMLLVKALHEGREAIFKVDLRQPNNKELFYSSKTHDVGGKLFYSNKTGMPVGYHTVAGVEFWDEGYKAFSRGIDKALPDTINHLKSFTEDENQYLLYTNSDIDSGTFYLGNRKEKSINPVAFVHQALDPALLRPSKRHLVTARDGNNIEVFVTLPAKYKDEPMPTIIYANHGRDDNAAVGGFDFLTQLWANRGYTVLQVNFRNNIGGYYQFTQGDVSQWAPNLYQDLADVSKWSTKQGFTNKDKMCLFGKHYAGYIALMAGAKNEQAFKCVATVGAMTDINNHLFNHKSFVSHDQMRARFSEDSSIQKAYSPISYAKTFTPSVLLIHGEKDSNVRSIQSRMMHNALRGEDKKSEHVEISEEDSSFTTDQSRMKVYAQLEAFFARHLN